MTFHNPLTPDGPDPFGTWHDGYYYVMVTEHNRLQLHRTADITRLCEAESRVIWRPPSPLPENFPAAQSIWAPEIHQLDGRWHVYFTGNTADDDDANRRLFVLRGPKVTPGGNPLDGPWDYLGPLKIPVSRYAIDGTVLHDGGRTYFIWSSKLPMGDGNWQHIMIAEMKDPVTLAEKEVIISKPTEAWERHDQPTNEGAQILRHGDDIWVGYSGSGFWSPHYAIGFLRARSGSDLLNPASWTKMPRPYFTQKPEAGVFGPGHASFIKSPDGREDWLFYHAWKVAKPGPGDVRSPRLQPVKWTATGEPDLGEPASEATALPLPSGTKR